MTQVCRFLVPSLSLGLFLQLGGVATSSETRPLSNSASQPITQSSSSSSDFESFGEIAKWIVGGSFVLAGAKLLKSQSE